MRENRESERRPVRKNDAADDADDVVDWIDAGRMSIYRLERLI